MASSKAPKNDFAPAWLKIPDQDARNNGKPGDCGGDRNIRPGRRDDFFGGYNRFDYGYVPLQRQRSFENYYDERRYAQHAKFRQHSVDDDYYGTPYGPYAPYYNGYSYDKYGNHYRSQPTLVRDSKYQHPNSRFGPGPLNGYHPYYDTYGYDYFPDHYYNPQYHRPPPPPKRPMPDKNGRPASRNETVPRDRSGSHSSTNSQPLEEDFPCLNGENEGGEAGKQSKPGGTAGVWDPSAKDSPNHSKSCNNNNIYKALLLNKRSNPDTGKPGSESNGPARPGPAAPFNKGPNTGRPAAGNREKKSPTPPVDILNTRCVTQPKNLPDKKSEFLRTLRKDGPSDDDKVGNKDSTGEDAKLAAGEMVNGKDSADHNGPSADMLSSSLEAEQRLLREMGWNEADDEEYEITEDEIREIQKLKTEMKAKNGFSKPGLSKAMSPNHLPLYQLTVQDNEDSVSSLSSDSDMD